MEDFSEAKGGLFDVVDDGQEKEENSLFSDSSSPSSSSFSSYPPSAASISSNNSESSITVMSDLSVSEVQSNLMNFPYDFKGHFTDTNRTLLNVITVSDLCDNSQVPIGTGSKATQIILDAVEFYAKNAQWEFFYCYLCDKKFLDAESHTEHLLYEHLPFYSNDRMVLLPASVKKSVITWRQDWKEPCLAWFKFMYDNDCKSGCFTKNIETRMCSDQRTRLLKQIGKSFDSLLSHGDYLSTGHLTRLIERTTDCFLGGLTDEKLAVATDILDKSLQLPIGMLDEKCLKLVVRRLKWLEHLFTRQGEAQQECDESEGLFTQSDDFIRSISLRDDYGELSFDPTKLSREDELPTEAHSPWTSAKMHEKFLKVFECMKSLLGLLNTKFEKKYKLLRNWDFVILLERVLFTESSRSSIRSSLEEWHDKLSQSSDLSRDFRINFVSDVLRIAQQLHKPIEVIFREIKYRQVLDELDTLDVEMRNIVSRIKKSKKELSLICSFDHRSSFLPFLREFMRSNTEPKSHHTSMRRTQHLEMPYRASPECPPNTGPTTSFLRTPLIHGEVELKKQSLALWSSLSEEEKKELLSVTPHSVYDYCCFHLKSPWLAMEVHKAIRFFTLHHTWRFFSCIACSRTFHDKKNFTRHHTVACKHYDITTPYWEWWGWRFRPEPVAETRLVKVLLVMDWTPIEVSSCALKVFAEMSLLNEFQDYAFLQWPIAKDDKRRTKRLNLLKSHLHTLLQQQPSILCYSHLRTMIDMAADQAFGQLTSKRDQFIFTKILKSSPVCFRFLDSKSLGRLVAHMSTIRRLTNRYNTDANYIYHPDSESEDYDPERIIGIMDDYDFKRINTKSDVFWETRENLDSISISHASFYLDVKKVYHPENVDLPLPWILDAPLVPTIFKYPLTIIHILGYARKQWDDAEENRWENVYKLRALHFYIRHLEEYTCSKRWIQLFGSGEKYNSVMMKRYEELLGNSRMEMRYLLSQMKKQKNKSRCNNCVRPSFCSCHAGCVASLETKSKFLISKQTKYYINTWQSIYRLTTLEPLASRVVDLDYRVILLPLIRSLLRMKLEVRLSGGGEEDFDKTCRNE